MPKVKCVDLTPFLRDADYRGVIIAAKVCELRNRR